MSYFNFFADFVPPYGIWRLIKLHAHKPSSLGGGTTLHLPVTITYVKTLTCKPLKDDEKH